MEKRYSLKFASRHPGFGEFSDAPDATACPNLKALTSRQSTDLTTATPCVTQGPPCVTLSLSKGALPCVTLSLSKGEPVEGCASSCYGGGVLSLGGSVMFAVKPARRAKAMLRMAHARSVGIVRLVGWLMDVRTAGGGAVLRALRQAHPSTGSG